MVTYFLYLCEQYDMVCLLILHMGDMIFSDATLSGGIFAEYNGVLLKSVPVLYPLLAYFVIEIFENTLIPQG